MNYETLYDQGKFPRTKTILGQIAKLAQKSWTQNTLSVRPAWWGRQAISNSTGGGGGILIRKIPGGYQVYHPNKGKYNYMKVIEKGRSRYNMKEALLSGKRARMGKRGPYVVIPLSKNEDGSPVGPMKNEINSVITKTGSYKEENARGQLVPRNRYKYRKDPGMTGRGNVFAVEQKYKNGKVQRSFMKFVTVTERSRGFNYPQIPAQRIQEGVKKDVDKALRSKTLKKAVASDMKGLIVELLSKKK
ncbi:hypothetical protein [Leptospira licerasiae]|uniref:Uncharacterized protein n=1 Tax=Leptospira licerasiae str. MMD4847 TaxID=1049971 RepID=A0ABN0H987_9LEPT|nr:hypothetical protein [Leptospira licerasiae]EIE01454.1 hypothetical protein LEP1GSC185_3936 [Leptospira licerasiae serovar Varillal str. VAR 010]EJZ42305.1 hypothetical protein LEP1GSC178_0005 [Leptospira licerasiae str. MMD4847]